MCANCHVRFDLHGGPRRNVEYCVTCHNAGTVDPDGGESVDMAYLAHSIHSGENRGTPYVIYGFGGSANEYSEVTYPQDTRFCETCHTNSAASPNGDDWKTNAGASQCGGCHVAGLGKTYDYATGLYTNTYAHSTFAFTANDGECLDCHTSAGVAGATLDNHDSGPRLSKELGAQFKYEVVSVTNVGAGKTPVVKFKISKPDGTPYVIATDPAFQGSSASLNLYFAWGNGDITNADSATGKTPAGNRGTPYRMRIADLKANAVLDGATGVYTTDLKIAGTPVVLTVDPTTAMVMIDGHPVVNVSGVERTGAAEHGRGLLRHAARAPRRAGELREVPRTAVAARRQPQRRSAGLHGVPQLERRLHGRPGLREPDRLRLVRPQHPQGQDSGGRASSPTRRAWRIARLVTRPAATTRPARVRWRSARVREPTRRSTRTTPGTPRAPAPAAPATTAPPPSLT